MTRSQIPGSAPFNQSNGQRTAKDHQTSHRSTYETDFVVWAESMAELLRMKRFDELDLDNLIDQVQDLSRRERSALCSNLEVISMHLLKWQFQPSNRSGSWRSSIREHRRRISKLLQQSPSLKPYLVQEYEDCYEHARRLASDETELPIDSFPTSSPYTIEHTLDPEYLP